MNDCTKEMLQWLQKPKTSLINNEWVSGSSKQTFQSINPSTGQVLATLQEASKDTVDQAVLAATKALHHAHWQNRSKSERAQNLHQVAELIRKNQAELATLESLDNGKLYREALGDVAEAASVFDYYSGWVNKFYGETCPVDAGYLNYTLQEPVGVCGLIIPWNFPLLIAAWKLGPCLAMGNTALIKPSPFTSLSLTYLLEQVRKQQIFPCGVINLILGGAVAGQTMANHAFIDALSFTGSTAIGKQIVQASGQSNLKSVSLELGGKSPNIIFDDVDDLDAILQNSFSALFSHKGEKCSEPTRFFIHEKHYEYGLSVLVKKANEIRCGDPFSKHSDQGPQCNREQMDKILGYIEGAKQEGATLLAGGFRDEEGANARGYFVRPTIFRDVSNHMKIAQEEIFGPVLAVSSFKDDDEVIDWANDTIYGLAAGIFTNNISKAHQAASKINAGMVFINHYGCYDHSSPFGGFKQSGWGKEMAVHSLRSYTKNKSVWVALKKQVGEVK